MTPEAPRVARVAGEAALVLLAVLAYLWLFRLYGFDVVDEGTQLAQIERAAGGARPYVDFETGYTPGYFAVQVALWRASGAELVATRTFGVLLHAATVALLYAAARLWLGGLVALCLVAVEVGFLLPVSARFGAPFNTPYPGWMAAPLALLAQVLVAGLAAARTAPARRRPSREAARLVAAGVAAGLAFSVKPNAGLFALGGAALALPAAWSAAWRGSRVLAGLLRAGALAATLALLGGAALRPGYALLLLLPVACAVARSAPRAPAAGGEESLPPWRDVALLGAGFLAVVLPWLVPLAGAIGIAGVGRDVLFLDARDVVAAYLLPLAPPGAAVAALCAGLLGAALVLRRGSGSHASRPGEWVLAPAALALGLTLAVALGGEAGARVTAEEACVWLGPLSLMLGLLLPTPGPEAARDRALLVFAAISSLQLFPRPDLIHVAMGAPPVLLAAGATWRALATSLPPARRRRLGFAAAGVVLALSAARLAPSLAARLGAPMVPLGAGLRAPLVVAARHAAETRWLGEAVRGIAARSAPGEAVFYFPDLAGLGFLAGRPSPFYYLYFVPGRPDREGEARTIAELERLKPGLAVVGEPRVAAFREAAHYFSRIEAHLARDFRPAAALSECVLLERGTPP